MKILSKIAFCLAIIFLLNGCGTDKKETRTLRLAHVLSPSHPVHKGMEYMAKRLKEKSNGRLNIEIYPSGQLGGSERECVEYLQLGSLAMTKVSAAVMENFVPEYTVLGLPYLFKSDTHRYKTLEGEIGRKILLKGQDKYLVRGLCYYDAGFRSFYTKNKAVKKPSDLKGLKIRTMKSSSSIKMVQEMGGNPTPISFGELYSALQQGVVDGAENNPASFVSSKHYEVCKHYSLNKHASIPDVLIISTVVWNSLSEQEKKWVQEAANESREYQKKIWDKAVKESIKLVKEEGVKVYRPDIEPFAKKVKPIYDYYKKNKPHLYNIIEKIKALN